MATALKAGSRWVMTGTPTPRCASRIHDKNYKENALYTYSKTVLGILLLVPLDPDETADSFLIL
jgi:hypothetical protein